MRAVAFKKALPANDPAALVDVILDRPMPGPRDLLVKVAAVSVNPADTKTRRRGDPEGGLSVLGWDAAGVVEAVGSEAALFKAGDAVFYAGSIMRPGTNSEYHLVDERIVGRKPSSLSFAEAAALPLTALTAWELLFDRIGVKRGEGADRRSLLIIGGAGGVGSIAIQIARQLTELTVIATASRPETEAWVRALGAHHVINHNRPLAPQLAHLGFPVVDIIIVLAGTDQNAEQLGELIAPEGHVGLIERPDALKSFDPALLFFKSVSIHLELMFTRARYATPTMIRQHQILNEVADLIDQGVLRTTLGRIVGPIDAANLREAHILSESSAVIGKLVLSGWPG